jgi:hypothetical protein
MRNDATSPVHLPGVTLIISYLPIILSPLLHFLSLPAMTRTTHAAPRTNPSSMAQSLRSRKSGGMDSVDVKQRKGYIRAVKLSNPKNDLDVDFSLKEHAGARVDEIEFEKGSGTPSQIRDASATQPRPQVQLVDLVVPQRKSQKGKGTYTSDIALQYTSEPFYHRWRL